jgi:hypothetical protein
MERHLSVGQSSSVVKLRQSFSNVSPQNEPGVPGAEVQSHPGGSVPVDEELELEEDELDDDEELELLEDEELEELLDDELELEDDELDDDDDDELEELLDEELLDEELELEDDELDELDDDELLELGISQQTQSEGSSPSGMIWMAPSRTTMRPPLRRTRVGTG